MTNKTKSRIIITTLLSILFTLSIFYVITLITNANVDGYNDGLVEGYTDGYIKGYFDCSFDKNFNPKLDSVKVGVFEDDQFAKLEMKN